MSEEAYGEGPVGPMILDVAVIVDVADVLPELATRRSSPKSWRPQGDRRQGR